MHFKETEFPTPDDVELFLKRVRRNQQLPILNLRTDPAKPGTVNISFVATREEIEGLIQRAAKRGLSPQNGLRRAISIMDFIDTEVEKGSNILLKEQPSFWQRLWDLPSKIHYIKIS